MFSERRLVVVEAGGVVVDAGVVAGTGLSPVGVGLRVGTVCAGTVAGGIPPLAGNTGTVCA